MIAQEISHRLNIPLDQTLVGRVKNTADQKLLDRAERLKNIRGAFRARRPIHGSRVLLIDDVITTGATVSEITGELYRAGASDVTVLTLARTTSAAT